MSETLLGRKCKYCRYYVQGWCYWNGRKAKSNDEECEDGFSSKE